MVLTTCPAEHELLPLLTRDSGPSEVREHVASCCSCRERLERLDCEVRALRDNLGDPSSHPLCDADAIESFRLAGEPSDPDETAEHRPAGSTATADSDSASTADGRFTAAPARIGKYLVVGELDDGGQATVYRVVHPGTGQDLALKLAKKQAPVGETHLDLSSSEARILGELDHPGLVRVVDLDVHEGRMFLVMDYIRGRSLQQYAKDRPVDSRAAAGLINQVALAAEAVHRRGIVHQDIKPKNILVDELGRARLIDFGLARRRHAWSLTEDGPSGGTPEFMAPEQAQGQDDRIGPRTDVFALGAVFYFLLTGHAPFRAGNQLEALDRARRNDFDGAALKKAGVARRLERIVLKAMATDPEDRQASAEAFARALSCTSAGLWWWPPWPCCC